jgi:FkbM family methyltransferase
MIKTATNIVKGVFRKRKRIKSDFKKVAWVQEKILKHQEDKNVKQVKIGNILIYYKRPYELLHSYKEIFQNEIYRFQSTTSKPLIIDCGSNIGLSVLYFKQIYPEARILAFEPDSNNYDILKRNAEANKLTNIELNNTAVWTKEGEISFEANESEASHISESTSGQKVKAIRLKDLLSSYKEIDFLKIDIEGAEWEVIRDCEENLKPVKNLFLEYHGKVEETDRLNELLAIISNNGFKVYIKNAADNLYHPFIEKQTGTIYDVQLNLFCYK